MLSQHTAGGIVHTRAQTQCIALSFASKIEVTVLKAGLLAYLAGRRRIVNLERQGCSLTENLQRGDVDLHTTGCQVGVRRTLGAGLDNTGDLDAELAAQVVRALGNLGLAEDHLGHTAAVAQIHEDHSTVVPTASDPTSQSYFLADVVGAEFAR